MASLRLSILLLSVTALAQQRLDIDAVAGRTLKEFQVPGIAVGVVADGRVVLAKAYGVLKAGETKRVTTKTLFQIASNTKAFTSAALAILVDEKKVSWDDRVVDIVPEFQMSDPYVTREMRVRDLLCHRSGLGLGAGDLLFFPDSELSTPEFLRHLRFVPLATSFRSSYAYDNVLYVAAGQVIEEVSRQPWGEFIKQRIFRPLGMNETRVRSSEVQPTDEVAAPHVPVAGKLQTIAISKLGVSDPAGSIMSSIDDMTRWIEVQLAGGKPLFSPRQQKEMWTPHIFVPIPDEYPKQLETLRPHWSAYGLGWFLNDYRGRRVVFHTGGLNGMVTRVTLVPEAKLGIVVLTNQQAGGAFNALTMAILDQYLGTGNTDWVSAYGQVAKEREEKSRKTVAEAAAHRAAESKPSLPLGKYAGVYRDPWYGDVSIREEGGKLAMSFSHSPSLSGTLEHFQYDTFIARWHDRSLDADAYVTFALKPDGSIRDVRMEPVSPSTDFSFDFQDLDLRPVK